MQTFVPELPLYLRDATLLSSLGDDPATIMAAMRAGLSRPAVVHGFPVTADDGEVMDITGFPMSLLTHGFDGAGRYSRLLHRLFTQIHQKLSALTPSQRHRLYLLVAVPNARRYREGLDVETGAALSDDQVLFNLYGQSWSEIVQQSLDAAGLKDAFVAVKAVEVTVADTGSLIRMAHEALRRDPAAMVIVSSVDTLTDTAGMNWLYQTGRLKSAIYPIGVMPGEAAATLFISSGRPDGAALRIESTATDVERHDLFAAEPPEGRALAALMSRHLAGQSGDRAWFIANLSGEYKPAYEWGMAQVHCQQQFAQLDLAESMWLPVVALGEVGISHMSVALIWAWQAFQRGYAGAERCGVLTLDHTTRRSLVTVSGVSS